MRGRSRVALLTVVLGVAMAVPAVANAASPTDVNGTWTSVDNADGSNQIMDVRVNPANRARIVLRDDDGLICGGGSALIARGKGSLSGDVITVDYKIKCDNGLKATVTGITYTYDAATGTLTDNFGVVWSRP